MGRELKRVPLDFNAPLNKVWKGYVAPKWRPCPSDDCANGSTMTGRWIERIASLFLQLGDDVAEQQRGRPIHPWLTDVALHPDGRPGADAALISAGLAGRTPSTFGHDSADAWRAAKAIYTAAGLDPETATCPVCQGHARHPDDLEAAEAWECTEPPEGDGFQLWETTSEGSPISPVFATLDELCDYAADHCSVFGDSKASAQKWREMLDENFVYLEVRHADGSSYLLI